MTSLDAADEFEGDVSTLTSVLKNALNIYCGFNILIMAKPS